MALTAEETKALLWQQNLAKRIVFGNFLASKLKAPSTKAEQVKKNFDPLRRT